VYHPSPFATNPKYAAGGVPTSKFKTKGKIIHYRVEPRVSVLDASILLLPALPGNMDGVTAKYHYKSRTSSNGRK
jgi:hypothetical protein